MANIPEYYQEHTRFSFNGHQTFPLKYGWLEKFSLDRLHVENELNSKTNQVLNLDYLVKEFGLGQNMAKSLSFWMRACYVLEESGANTVFTDFAKAYFGKNGIDPFLEEIGTIWIIHWYLSTASKRTSTWFWFFNFFDKKSFERQELVQDILELCEKDGPHKTITNETQVRKDVDCFIKSYLGVINPKLSSEDSLESPLTELGLFRKGTGNTIQLVETERHNLPYGLFILSIYAFWEKLGAASGTLSFENLLAQPYSPGRLFAINREGLLQKLENINDKTNGILSFDQSSGLSQLIINDQLAFQNICKKNNHVSILSRGSME